MKTKIIAVVIVLAAALGTLMYVSSRKRAELPPPPQTAAPQAEQGVALPAGATEYSAPASVAPISTYIPSAGPADYSKLSLIPAAMAAKGTCEKGSPKDIIEAHGRVWGYFMGQNVGFNPDQTDKTYQLLSEYYACASMARGDDSLCDSLPGEAQQGNVTVALSQSPQFMCKQKAAPILFRAYLAGRTTNLGACQAELNDWYPDNVAKVSPPDFCSSAAKGPASLASYLASKMPQSASMSRMYLPASASSCGGDRDCQVNYSLYKAFSDGSPAGCPPALRPYCSALMERTQAACAPILDELSKNYCSSLADASRRSKGYVGMTPDQVKADIQLQAQKKSDADKQHQENEKSMKILNQNVKTMMDNMKKRKLSEE